MPLKTRPREQFTVLVIGDINMSRRQNFVVAAHYDDIVLNIESAQFGLILLDFTADCWNAPVPGHLRHFRYPWQSELVTRIKAPAGINNQTPLVAITHPENEFTSDPQYPMAFYDCLPAPLTEQRVNEIIDLWQAKALAFDYVQTILSKTKNNRQLTLTLFEKLFEELPAQIVVIENALKNRHYDLAKEITHKINGSASFCGLTAIQQSANALESCLLNSNFANAHQHFLMLHQCTLSFMRPQSFILATLSKCQDHKKAHKGLFYELE
jgi:HPt (histidine-containing phosphotransfer) domain-containing protein